MRNLQPTAAAEVQPSDVTETFTRWTNRQDEECEKLTTEDEKLAFLTAQNQKLREAINEIRAFRLEMEAKIIATKN